MRSSTIRGILTIGLLTGLYGCTSFTGYPDPPNPPPVNSPEPGYLLGDEAIKEYRQVSDPDAKRRLRDEIVDARMLDCDKRFRDFERGLQKEGVEWGVGTDWALLAISGATATVGGEAVKAALGAASTGLQGAKSSFDKRVLLDRTLVALIAQMHARREKVRTIIRSNQQQSALQYTLFAALSDLESFENAGSIPDAIGAISEEAGSTVKAEVAKQEAIIRGSFSQAPEAVQLRALLYDAESKKLNPEKKKLAVDCMNENNIPIDPGALGDLLVIEPDAVNDLPELKANRVKIIQCLQRKITGGNQARSRKEN